MMRTYIIFCRERGRHEDRPGVYFATKAHNKLRAFDRVFPFAEEAGYRAIRSGVKRSVIGLGALKGKTVWYEVKQLSL